MIKNYRTTRSLHIQNGTVSGQTLLDLHQIMGESHRKRKSTHKTIRIKAHRARMDNSTGPEKATLYKGMHYYDHHYKLLPLPSFLMKKTPPNSLLLAFRSHSC